ncbi:hypothetical protein BUY35_00055 [Staphylococcus cohnii]|nr:hypothetical protein BUY35_00055 [Staphylococcus cohnii]
MQGFHYVSEYDLTQTNFIERAYRVTSIEFLMQILLSISVIFIVLAFVFYMMKIKIAPALLIIAIFMLGVTTFIMPSFFNEIGHFEAEGQVVGFTGDKKDVVIQYGNKEKKIEASVPDNQSFKKDDEVLVKTETRPFAKRPTKEGSELGVYWEKVSAFKR